MNKESITMVTNNRATISVSLLPFESLLSSFCSMHLYYRFKVFDRTVKFVY